MHTHGRDEGLSTDTIVEMIGVQGIYLTRQGTSPTSGSMNPSLDEDPTQGWPPPPYLTSLHVVGGPPL